MDVQRGYLLNVMLTKIAFQNAFLSAQGKMLLDSSAPTGCSTQPYPPDSLTQDTTRDTFIQIVGMSATLPSLALIARWLGAVPYETAYRPVKLREMVLCNDRLLCYAPPSTASTGPCPPNVDLPPGKLFEAPHRFGDHWKIVIPEWKAPEMKAQKDPRKHAEHACIPIVWDSVARGMNTLLFCPTKKQVEATAKTVCEACERIEWASCEPGWCRRLHD